jgi:hypothetical protein
MPNPKNYKDKKKWMKDCLHTTLHLEKKKKDQGLAQCLNEWHNKGKKVASIFLEHQAEVTKEQRRPIIKYIKEYEYANVEFGDVKANKYTEDNLYELEEDLDTFRGIKLSSFKKEVIHRIINTFLNITAGYDREKIKPGYKGKFLINDHQAEKAGHHFDLRLEFPVTSLENALGTYKGKRKPGGIEPVNTYPDKPGTVYRSFAVKKHTIPTDETKLFIVETEDHDINYDKFEGEITEGYGKGDVGIYDKGTYELIDVDGDKKYVIEFKGKKLKGTFSLIKYQTGYLWVKNK